VAIEKAIYAARAKATGGRIVTAKTKDGQLDLRLDRPKEMVGRGRELTRNSSSQLAMRHVSSEPSEIVAGKRHIRITDDVFINSEVSFGPLAGGVEGFGIAVALMVHLPGIDKSVAEELVHAAHQVCPYSNATRGNIDVALSVA